VGADVAKDEAVALLKKDLSQTAVE